MKGIKEHIVNIIIERRLEGKDIPLWIKWFFPHLVEEVDPVVRMLKGDSHDSVPEKKGSMALVYGTAMITIIAMVLMISPIMGLGLPMGGGVKSMKTEKVETVRTFAAPIQNEEKFTATTPTKVPPSIKEKLPVDIKPNPKLPPGRVYPVPGPVEPPKEEK